MTLVPVSVEHCTLAVPTLRATIEAQLASADDTCMFLAKELQIDVFHAPMLPHQDPQLATRMSLVRRSRHRVR